MDRTHVERLALVARDIGRGDRDRADRDLTALLAEVGRDPDPRVIDLYVFGAALARRISGTAAAEANLYLRQFDVPQIHLFNLLAVSAPFVGLAGVIANREIQRTASGDQHPTVIDVGIGTGRQVVALLEAMTASETLPAALTVIGIEPSEFCLDLAHQNVADAARKAGLPVTFRPFLRAAEAITFDEWHAIKAACTGRPVINASFALHHVGDVGGKDVRNDLLRRLRWLDPKLLVLSEPNVHHYEKDFLRRFHNCWEHFRAAFAAVDGTTAALCDKNALKVCFFGREIADILANAEEQRSERHESTASWLARLAETGWDARYDGELPDAGEVITPRKKDGYASLDFRGAPLVSVLCAVPKKGSGADADAAVARAPNQRPARRKRRDQRRRARTRRRSTQCRAKSEPSERTS
jgi:SAM-dependent methyltransferase